MLQAQIQITEIDFETASGYTTSVPEFTDGNRDFFLRTDGTDMRSNYEVFGKEGDYFFAGEDLDAEGASIPLFMYLDTLSITGFDNLTFSVLIAEDDDGANQDWDIRDYVHINYSIDGGPSQNLIWIRYSGSSNSEPALDSDFDEVGDSTRVTSTFQPFTANIAGTGDELAITLEWKMNGGQEDLAIDLIQVTGNPTAGGNDFDSEVSAPSVQIPASNIASLADTPAEVQDVFRFNIDDSGNSDGQPTIITEMVIKSAANNTVDWTDNIQGVTLSNGSTITIQSVDIQDTAISMVFDPGDFSIPDGTNQDINLGIYLYGSNLTDNEVFAFRIDADDHGFINDISGSLLTQTFSGGDVVSNDITLAVTATKIDFLVQPYTLTTRTIFSPALELAYLDANNNVDADFDGIGSGISLASSKGTFTDASTTSAIASNGIIVFDNLAMTFAKTDITLIATDLSSSFTAARSDSFNVTVDPFANTVIINELDENGDPDRDWEAVELLVVRGPVDMRNWILREDTEDDNLVFADDPIWSGVPKGTYITVYVRNSSPAEQDLDASDFTMAVVASGGYISGNARINTTNEAFFLFSGPVANENAIDGINFGVDVQDDYGLTVPNVGDNTRVAYFSNGSDFNNDSATHWAQTNTHSLGGPNPGQNDSSLPVEMVSFSAQAGNQKVLLEWETFSETQNLGYILKRALNSDDNFVEIASYLTHPDDLRGLGTSSSGKAYAFIDADYSLINGTTYYYKIYDVDYNGTATEYSKVVSAMPAENAWLPGERLEYELSQNFPNPFNPSTTIRIQLGHPGENVSLIIYDIMGRKVRVLHQGVLAGTAHSFTWDGHDSNGRQVASGIYYYQLNTPGYSKTKKMILMK
jgi:hypothetical protein